MDVLDDVCFLCRSAVVLDDVALRNVSGHVICLRCYVCSVKGDRPFPAPLRRAIESLLSSMDEFPV